MIDLAFGENANLLHGKDYSLHVTQKLGAKIDNTLVKENLGNWNTTNAKFQRSIKRYKLCLYRKLRCRETKKQR